MAAIVERATQFLPALSALDPGAASVRVGLRPYAAGGLPLVGPVASQPGLFVAAGHEGSGLCLGPATAELVLQHALGGSGGAQAAAGALNAGAFEALLPDVRVAAAAM